MAVEDAVLRELDLRYGTDGEYTAELRPENIVETEEDITVRIVLYGFAHGDYKIDSINVSRDGIDSSIDAKVEKLREALGDGFDVEYHYDSALQNVTHATLTRALPENPSMGERFVVNKDNITYMRGRMTRTQRHTHFHSKTPAPFNISPRDLTDKIRNMKIALDGKPGMSYIDNVQHDCRLPSDVISLTDKFEFDFTHFEEDMREEKRAKHYRANLYPDINDASHYEVMFLTALTEKERSRKCYQLVIDDGYVVTIKLEQRNDGRYTIYGMALDNLNDASQSRIASVRRYLEECAIWNDDKERKRSKEASYGLFEGSEFFDSFVSSGDIDVRSEPAFGLDAKKNKITITYGMRTRGHYGISFARQDFLTHIETLMRIAYR